MGSPQSKPQQYPSAVPAAADRHPTHHHRRQHSRVVVHDHQTPSRTDEFHLVSPVSDISDPSVRKLPINKQQNNGPSNNNTISLNNYNTGGRILVLENAPPPPQYIPPHLIEGRTRKNKKNSFPQVVKGVYLDAKKRVQQQQADRRPRRGENINGGRTNERPQQQIANSVPRQRRQAQHDKPAGVSSSPDRHAKAASPEQEGEGGGAGRVKDLFMGCFQESKEHLNRVQEQTRQAVKTYRDKRAASHPKNADDSVVKEETKKVEDRRRRIEQPSSVRRHQHATTSAMLMPTPTSFLYDADEPTPHQALDTAFALHQEDDYFQRLAPVLAQSPFCVPSKYDQAATLLVLGVGGHESPYVSPEAASVKNDAKVAPRVLLHSSAQRPTESSPTVESVSPTVTTFSVSPTENSTSRTVSSSSTTIASTPVGSEEPIKPQQLAMNSSAKEGGSSSSNNGSSAIKPARVSAESQEELAEEEEAMVEKEQAVTVGTKDTDERDVPGVAKPVPVVAKPSSKPPIKKEPAAVTAKRTTEQKVPAVAKSVPVVARPSSEPPVKKEQAAVQRGGVVAKFGARMRRSSVAADAVPETKARNKKQIRVSEESDSSLLGATKNSAPKQMRKKDDEKEKKAEKKKKGPRLSDMMASSKIQGTEQNVVVSSISIGDAQSVASFNSEDMSLRVTESAPSVLETHDYRNIALSNGRQHESPAPLKQESKSNLQLSATKDLPLMSPSADSLCSSVGQSPAVPLVSNQALSNAAFLFSPSYVGGKPHMIRMAEPPKRESYAAFTISTAESRSRLSAATSRSLPAFHIPVSRAVDGPLQISHSIDEDDYSMSVGTRGRAFRNSSSTANSEKHVRFSSVQQLVGRESLQPSMIETVDYPGIESKPSDLSDLTDARSIVSHGAETLPSVSEEREEELVSPDRVHLPAEETPAKLEGSASSGSSGHWTCYRDVNGKLVAATPLISNKRQSSESGKKPTTTKSPMLRFQAAKAKFGKPAGKKAPARKTPPKKFTKRNSSSSTTSVVLSRVAEINGRLRSNRDVVSKNPRRDTSADNAVAPRKPVLVHPLFREQQETSFAAEQPSQVNISVAPYDEKKNLLPETIISEKSRNKTVPFDESTLIEEDEYEQTQKQVLPPPRQKSVPFDESTMIAQDDEGDNSISVSSTESEDIFDAMMKTTDDTLLGPMDEESDVEDDPFSSIMHGGARLSPSGSSRSSMSSIQGRKLSLSAFSRRSSVVSRSSEEQSAGPSVPFTGTNRRATTSTNGTTGSSLRSFFSKSSSVPTIVADKENSLNYLSFANDKVTVNPCEQRHPVRGSLCLSPVQRTPVQARKWRTLAAAAKEKEQHQKQQQQGSKKKNGRGGGLRVRNSAAAAGGGSKRQMKTAL